MAVGRSNNRPNGMEGFRRFQGGFGADLGRTGDPSEHTAEQWFDQ